jgi:hypothetical protein
VTERNTKEIEYRQLCAIVKTILQQEPSIDDAEWKARTRDTLAKWGFQEPDTDALSRAMAQVEYALRKTIGPRPLRPVPTPETGTYTPPSDPAEPTTRTHRPAGWDIVVGLMAKLQQEKQGSAVSAPSVEQPAEPRETLAISEEDALVEFWKAAGDYSTDRLALLRAFAELAIVRPADWDTAEIRRDSLDPRLRAEGCFCCRKDWRAYHWHHVIQIQFGGSNYVRNRVPLCGTCHGAIHPWLPASRLTAGSWFHIGGLDAKSVEMLQRLRKRETGAALVAASPAGGMRTGKR